MLAIQLTIYHFVCDSIIGPPFERYEKETRISSLCYCNEEHFNTSVGFVKRSRECLNA